MGAKYAKVVIEGSVFTVNQLDDLPISLKFSLDSVTDFNKVRGYRSKRNARLPVTTDASIFFEEWEKATRINPEAVKWKEFFIEVNGLPVLRGRCQLGGAKLAGNVHRRKGREYKVGFYGNNVDWFDCFEGKTLKEFAPNPAVETFNQMNVFAGTNADYETSGDEWGYHLVKWKTWKVYGEVQGSEFTPFAFVAPIVKRMFESCGYTIKSEFMDKTFWKRLIMPLGWRDYTDGWYLANTNMEVEKTIQQTIPALTPWTRITYDQINYGGAHFSANGTYTAPYDGTYTITGYHLMTLAQTQPALFDVPYVWINGADSGQLALQYEVVLNAGDTIELYVFNPPLQMDIYSGVFRVTYKANYGDEYGFPVVVNELFKEEWLATDFLKGLTEAFGLVWDTDGASDVVCVEPKDRWKQRERSPDYITLEGLGYFLEEYTTIWNEHAAGGGSGRPLDFTHKLDFSKKGELKALNRRSRYVQFCWKEDGSDDTMEAMNEGEPLAIGCGVYDLGENRFREKVEKLENSFFAATLQYFAEEIQHASSVKVPGIPLIYAGNFLEGDTESETEYDFEPRLLYWAGRRGGLDGTIDFEGMAGDYPMSFFVNYGDLSNGYDPSLAFSDQILITGNTVRGLINVFHLQELKRKSVGKLLDEHVFWNVVDVLDLNFRHKIYIDGAKYLLKELDGYKMIDGRSTRTLLLLDCAPELADADNITPPDVDGYVGQPYPDGECGVDVELAEVYQECVWSIAMQNESVEVEADDVKVYLEYDLFRGNACAGDETDTDKRQEIGEVIVWAETTDANPMEAGWYVDKLTISAYVNFGGAPLSGSVQHYTMNNLSNGGTIVLNGTTAQDYADYAFALRVRMENVIYLQSLAGFGVGAQWGIDYDMRVEFVGGKLRIGMVCKHDPNGLWLGFDKSLGGGTYKDNAGIPNEYSFDMVTPDLEQDIFDYWQTLCGGGLYLLYGGTATVTPDVGFDFWNLDLSLVWVAYPDETDLGGGYVMNWDLGCNTAIVTATPDGCTGAEEFTWYVDPGLGEVEWLQGIGEDTAYLYFDAGVRVIVRCGDCLGEGTITIDV